MTKKSLFTLLILLLTVTIFAMTACNSASVASISITEGSVFKTQYVVGEELDISGIELEVELTDGKTYTVVATDVRENLKVLGFSTATPKRSLVVILDYKGATASYTIEVVSKEDDTQKCLVVYETGRGSKVEDDLVPAYSSLKAPKDPTCEGYEFDGWYKESTYNNRWNFNTDKVVYDTVLYAKWAKLYKVTFVDEVNEAPNIVRYVKEGATLTDVPTLPEREGEDGSWDRKVFTNVRADIVVHSVYTTREYTVRFVYMGTDGKTQIEVGIFEGVKHGTDLSEAQADRIREMEDTAVPEYNADRNKHFVGWDTSFEHITSDLTVVAVYKINTYKVTFDLNYEKGDGTEYGVKEGISHGNAVDAPQVEPQRAGYAFDGWYTQVEGVTAWNFNSDRVERDITLYAKWVKVCYVRYLIAEDIVIDDEDQLEMSEYHLFEDGVLVKYKVYFVSEVREGGNATKPQVPQKRGHEGRWNVEDVNLTKIENDISVKIAYTKKSYTVKFYNYNRDLLKEEVVIFGDPATAPTTAPTRIGYSFEGWDKAFDSVESDLEVTATFEASIYTVRFYPNNGIPYVDQSIAYDSEITVQPFDRSGYRFVTWCEDIALEEPFEIKGRLLDRSDADANGIVLELYAKWNKLHTVNYYDEGNNLVGSEEVEDGFTAVNVPDLESAVGYTSAWREKDENGIYLPGAFDFTKPIGSDKRLFCDKKYEIIKYHVRFYVDNSLYVDADVDHGQSVNQTMTVADPSVEGKKFITWDKNLNMPITSDTDYTAVLETNRYTITWGKTGITTEVEYGNPAVFPPNETAPSKRGYTLVGWEASGGYDMNRVTRDMRVEALFEINTYTLTFVDLATNAVYQTNAGVDETHMMFNTPFSPDEIIGRPTKVGFDFTGWRVGTKQIAFSPLTDCWVLRGTSSTQQGVDILNGYLVGSDDKNYFIPGSSDIHQIINVDGWESTVDEITYDGEHWHIGDQEIVALDLGFGYGAYYVLREDTKFYATFERSNCIVSYVTGTEEVTVDAQVYPYGSAIQAPTVTERTDYVFIGWYVDAELTDRFEFDGSVITEDVTLYARWEERRESTIGLEYALTEDGSAYAVVGISELPASTVNVVVANYYNGKPVTAIGVEAFADANRNQNIVNIDLPGTIATIGPKAFMGCVSLESITIPTAVKVIPDNAFNGCTALTTVSFPIDTAVERIGKSAFAGATNLKYSKVDGVQVDFTLPDTLVQIEDGAFHNAMGLVALTIPRSVIEIGSRAFAGANHLRYVVFERNNPCNLGNDAFLNTTMLSRAFRMYVNNVQAYTTSALGANWTAFANKIMDATLVSADGLWSYTIASQGVKLEQYLGRETVIGVPATISSVNGNLRVKGLGDYVFDSTVTTVEMFSTCAISPNTFGSADNLESISVTIEGYGTGYAIDSGYLVNAYEQCVHLDTFAVTTGMALSDIFGGVPPASLTKVIISGTINDNMLANCSSIREVVIRDAAYIGANAFVNCTSLSSVTFELSGDVELMSIGASAFEKCTSIASDSFKTIVEDGTERVGLPSSITVVGQNAFANTSWINSYTNSMIIIGDGILYKYNGNDSVVNIESTVKSITPYAFEGNTSLTRVVVLNPNVSAMTNIGDYAFANCVRLESVIIPKNVTRVGASAFSGCSKLATVAIFGNNTQMGENAFRGTISDMRIFAPGTASYPDLAGNITYVSGMDVHIGEIADEKWLYAEGVSYGKVLLKYLGDSDELTIQTQYNGIGDVSEIADYALTRSLKSLAFRASVKEFVRDKANGTKVFAGVTELESLTVYNYDNVGKRISASLLGGLLQSNQKLTAIDITSARSVVDMFGATLPERIDTVNIIVGEAKIADGFIAGSRGVKHVNVTIDDEVYALEDTAGVDGHVFTSIGSKAFADTAWIDAYDGDYIIVLNGNLVDYKGKNSVLDIPEGVSTINAKVFENDAFVEIVNIPTSVTAIGANAFAGAGKLTKVFVKATTAPSVNSGCFDSVAFSERGLEIFVPSTAYDSYTSNGVWNVWSPISDNGVKSFEYGIDEYTSGGRRYEVRKMYIVDTVNQELLLARRYTVGYEGTEVKSVTEATDMSVTSSVTDGNGVSYAIVSLGNNVFMSDVKRVVVDLSLAVNDKTFKSISEFRQIAFTGARVNSVGISGKDIRDILMGKNVSSMAYDGATSLDVFLDVHDDGDRAGLTALKEIEILEGVTTTADELLVGYDGIESVVYHQGILSIGVNSFENTAWYANQGDYVILGGVLYKYKGRDPIVEVPSSVKIINTSAFCAPNARVSRVRFAPDSKAHTILDYAFSGISSLGSITLPPSMVRISANAFEGTAFTYTNDTLFLSGDSNEDITLVHYQGTSETYTIPVEVVAVSAGAFRNNTHIKAVNCADGGRLARVHEYAFNGCTNLATVTLSATLSHVGKEAFHGTAWFQNKVKTGKDVIIGSETSHIYYQKVTSKKEFEITRSVKSVTDGAFNAIGSTDVGVTTVKVAHGAHIAPEELYNILKDARVKSFGSDGSLRIRDLIGSDEVLPNISELLFVSDALGICANYADGWNSVTEVNGIGSSVKSIGESAFRGTAWYEGLLDETYVFADQNSGIIIKYNGSGGVLNIGGNNAVTGIAPDVFRGNTTITGITFSEGSTITEIPAGAFKGCSSLTNINLPSSVSVYGKDAFAGTAWIENIESDYVILDGKLIAYRGNGGEIVIPEEVTKIYSYVFADNLDITGVTFARYNMMSEIDVNAFAGCVNLESVTVSENIDRVDRTAFSGTAWEESATYLYYVDSYNGIKKIVLYLGSDTNVNIPQDVTEISATAFQGVTTIKSLMIPNNTKLKSIPAYCFKDCTALTNVTIAPSITDIGEGAFDNTKWKSAYDNQFVVVNGRLIAYKGTDTIVTLPDSVRVIGVEAFRGNKETVRVNMPDSVAVIEAHAFDGCEALTTVGFGNGVEEIGAHAFSGTPWLTSRTEEFVEPVPGIVIAYNGTGTEVVFPSSANKVNADVFAYKPIVAVTFTADVTIDDGAFEGCTSLTTVVGAEYIVSASEKAFEGTPYLASVTKDGYVVINGALVGYNGSQTSVVIPEGVTTVKASAFAGNANIVSVDFSNVVGRVRVESGAFANCTALNEVTLSENIDYIGNRAFYNTSWIRSGDIKLIITENGKILSYVAEDTEVVIPKNATSIAEGVFSGNEHIQKLIFNADCAIDIPEYAFKNCSKLLSVVFPTTAFEIGKGAFEGTQWQINEGNKSTNRGYVIVRGKLIAYVGTSTEVVIPSNVSYIYDYVFRGNDKITKLSFATGNTITEVVGETFKDCSALETVVFRSNVEYIDMGAFAGTPWSASEIAKSDFILVEGKLVSYVGNGGEVEIASDVHSIGKNIFTGNTTVTGVRFVKNSDVTVIPKDTFAGCTNLATVVLPLGIEDIGKDAFSGTAWLQAVIDGGSDAVNGGSIIGEAYVIKGRALIYVGEDNEFIMPDGIANIAKSFFSGGVTKLVLTSADPYAVTYEPGALNALTEIWVPKTAIDVYRSSETWSAYAYRIKAIEG